MQEVKRSKYFSILVDEVTSFNKEIMPLCVRFVDSNSEIREEFLQFSVLPRINKDMMGHLICQVSILEFSATTSEVTISCVHALHWALLEPGYRAVL